MHDLIMMTCEQHMHEENVCRNSTSLRYKHSNGAACMINYPERKDI